ncbi:MAG: exodeoxyribonuclease VII small subunit [Gammaproteobacteria bacterium]|nr:exodeoxyribonuclease VII small subunit [Gammaproteobacteria bacterium]
MAARPDKIADTPNVATFEASLKELEALVQRMEQGEQPLDEALRDFERGVQLARQCQAMLASAQAKVDMLSNRTDQPEPFLADNDAR